MFYSTTNSTRTPMDTAKNSEVRCTTGLPRGGWIHGSQGGHNNIGHRDLKEESPDTYRGVQAFLYGSHGAIWRKRFPRTASCTTSIN